MQNQIWAYLKKPEMAEFTKRAAAMNMSEGELNQLLIRMFLTIPEGSYQPNVCVKCQYYQIGSSNVIQMFMKLNEALSLVTPEYRKLNLGAPNAKANRQHP